MRPTDALMHPADWGTATVAGAVEIKRGISWSKDQEHAHPRDDRVPVIRIGNVQARLELDDLVYLSGLKPVAVRKKRVAAGWTIIVGSNGNRARIGNAVLIRNDDEFLFASFLIGAKPKSGSKLRAEYFYRWLSSERVQAYLSASSEGTTGLNNLSHSFFRAMAISVPPPSEQVGIAGILDAVDTTLECTRASVERARQLRKSLIQELLAQGLRNEKQKKSAAGLIPESWACEHLGDHIQDGPTNGVYRPETDYATQGTRIVRIDDFADGKINSIQALRRVVVEPPIQRRYALAKDDVLINRVNSLSHIGKAALVPVLDEPTIFESNMMRLRCGPRLASNFLTIVLCSDIARRHWLARAKPAVNQASVNQRDVCELSVPLPEKPEQEDIARILSAADEQIELLSRVVAAYQQLKTSLMHDLLTGRVRVSNGIKEASS
jgi:type I restriction enzyme, S subunit